MSKYNEWYQASGIPAPGQVDTDEAFRGEFNNIATAAQRMPTLTGNGGKVVKVNAGATALETATLAEAQALLGASFAETVAVKASDTARTSATLTNDPDLAVAVSVDRVYRIRGLLVVSGGNIRLKMTVPLYAYLNIVIGTTEGFFCAAEDQEVFDGISTEGPMVIEGQIVSPTNAGSMTLQWSSDSGTTTLKAGSWLSLADLGANNV